MTAAGRYRRGYAVRADRDGDGSGLARERSTDG
jgi:hypothetical protein